MFVAVRHLPPVRAVAGRVDESVKGTADKNPMGHGDRADALRRFLLGSGSRQPREGRAGRRRDKKAGAPGIVVSLRRTGVNP
ncbi:MAG: hypothetical protein NTW86_02490 [Candidatus Sumerlaeota bacterium]|nr:hypothetical protein [Candidatus Sumerlaeota bacterium]